MIVVVARCECEHSWLERPVTDPDLVENMFETHVGWKHVRPSQRTEHNWMEFETYSTVHSRTRKHITTGARTTRLLETIKKYLVV